jgi:hypothetical protein
LIQLKGNKMKNLSSAVLLILGLACAQSESEAGVASAMIHGNSCFNASAATLSYSQWGPYNSGNTGITVNCPLGLPDEAYTSFRYYVTGWSRNSSATKLSCTLTTTGSSGSGYGISTATVPYSMNDAKTANATTYPAANITPFPYLTCYIPPAESGMFSYLSTIIVRGLY